MLSTISKKGDLKKLKNYLKKNTPDIKEFNYEALRYAKDSEICKELLIHCDINEVFNWACENNQREIIKVLIKEKLLETNFSFLNHFHKACKKCYTKLAELLFTKIFSQEKKLILFELVCQSKSVKLVKEFIHDIDENQLNNAFIDCCKERNYKILKELLKIPLLNPSYDNNYGIKYLTLNKNENYSDFINSLFKDIRFNSNEFLQCYFQKEFHRKVPVYYPNTNVPAEYFIFRSKLDKSNLKSLSKIFKENFSKRYFLKIFNEEIEYLITSY